MASFNMNQLFVAIALAVAVCSVTADESAKLTLNQKVATSIKSKDRDIQLNTIAGSSDYVPESGNLTTESVPTLSSSTTNSAASLSNTTRSQANVFEATAPHNGTTHSKDPLLVNAQSPNPFLSNVPGGVNPQIAMLLQNNPRLQMLARQNPIVAQQIMRNPALLRDPQIQRAIQSQLSPGQGQNLLGQLGQVGLLNGLGRALNPLGLPIGGGFNPLLQRQQQANQRNRMGQMGQNQLNQNQNGQMGNNFGLPRAHQPAVNQNQETLPGGYYGNNDNYNNANPTAENGGNEEAGGEEGADQGSEGEGEGAGADPGSQDYDGNSGDGTGGEDQSAAGGEEQQNPAEDPDIQQLQNFGGPVNDNFPEGLFPPGLLTKEDIEEIRKQQEKQQKEAEERERQQQQQQNPQAGQGADYEDTGDDGTGASNVGGGEEVPTDGTGQEGAGDEGNNVETGAGEEGAGQEQGQPEMPVTAGQVDQGYTGVTPGYVNERYPANPSYTSPTPPAYKNAYQPIQPLHQSQRVPLQPSIDYANDYPNSVQQHNSRSTPLKNQFNYQPGVQYDQPYQMNNYQLTTTPSPIPISQQYGKQVENPLLSNFNGPPQPSYFGGVNRFPQQHRHNSAQPLRPWQQSPQSPLNYDGGFNAEPRQLHSNRGGLPGGALGPMTQFDHNNNAINNDSPYRSFNTPANPAYRPNIFNEQRPAYQQRQRAFLA